MHAEWQNVLSNKNHVEINWIIFFFITAIGYRDTSYICSISLSAAIYVSKRCLLCILHIVRLIFKYSSPKWATFFREFLLHCDLFLRAIVERGFPSMLFRQNLLHIYFRLNYLKGWWTSMHGCLCLRGVVALHFSSLLWFAIPCIVVFTRVYIYL